MFWANVPACRSLYIGLICTVVILWGAVTSWFCCPCCPGAKYIEEKQARCTISFRMSDFLIILGDWVGCPAGNRKMSRIQLAALPSSAHSAHLSASCATSCPATQY